MVDARHGAPRVLALLGASSMPYTFLALLRDGLRYSWRLCRLSVVATTFHQLNAGWNAEPNAPDPRIETDDNLLRLSFTLNHMVFDVDEGDVGQIVFRGCWRYRLGATNDEGWYRGQCRFGKMAPQWGEFYEVAGDLLESGVSDWRVLGAQPEESRHFLFYLRDCTFECDAKDWTLILPDRSSAIART